MKNLIHRVFTLIQKELVVELRGKEVLTLILCTGLILCALIGSGVSNAILEMRVVGRIFPMMVWITFFFSATLAMTRAHDSELEGRGFEALLLYGISGAEQFTAKVICTYLLLFLSYSVSTLGVAIALDQTVLDILSELAILGALTSLGIAPLMVVLGGIASTSRLRGVLLPLLVIPLLFPFFFAGTELTAQLTVARALDMSSPWISLLVAADTIFLLLGLNLYEFALRD
jgi:ABC-type transport system involved in cytochrome c biogenesis permease component